MAITAFSQWSTTAALNIDLNNIPLDSAVMTASQVDDAIREMMAQLKSAGFITSGAFAATITPSVNDGAALGTAALSWSDLFLASGAVININNGNWVATHTSAVLTVGTGDIRITTAGTNSASVVTVGGTQTLTNKTLTAPVLGAATATSINFGGNALSVYTESDNTAISQGSGITAGGGTFTSASGTRSYTRVGRLVTVTYDVTITTLGTASTSMVLTLPFTADANGGPWVGAAVESSGNNPIVGTILESGTAAVIPDLPLGWMGNGISIVFTISYWA